MPTCSISDCDNAVVAKGFCGTHYASERRKNAPPCIVDGCDGRQSTLGFCPGHYRRHREGKDMSRPVKKYARRDGLRDDGYRMVYVNGRSIVEHRYVMEQSLGRLLESHETVHHRNGIRSDNSLANLELWTHRHPKGQRVEDQVRWAREILDLYGDLF